MKTEVASAPKRLFFIDAIRAWAILMMLQGHFVDGLLAHEYRNPEMPVYALWRYFRGVTAPVFFTVSGFIFTYLLVKAKQSNHSNPRVNKGFKRGLELVCYGYILRTNIFGLLKGKLYDSFFVIDVLHCIGLAIIGVLLIYTLTKRFNTAVFSSILLLIAIALFTYEPYYKLLDYSQLPKALANYVTKANGSVFTIIPWFGYTCIGGFMATIFYRYAAISNLYIKGITILIPVGLFLLFLSSPTFSFMAEHFGITILEAVANYNYLYIRLGDVCLAFAFFMLLENYVKHPTFLKIGQSTLSIYVIHFMILYGSFTGFGLYQTWNHQLTAIQVIFGAILFIVLVCSIALFYEKQKAPLFNTFHRVKNNVIKKLQ